MEYPSFGHIEAEQTEVFGNHLGAVEYLTRVGDIVGMCAGVDLADTL